MLLKTLTLAALVLSVTAVIIAAIALHSQANVTIQNTSAHQVQAPSGIHE